MTYVTRRFSLMAPFYARLLPPATKQLGCDWVRARVASRSAENMDVVWFAEIKWDYLRTRKQQLIRRRPAHLPVLFLEPYVRGRENHYQIRDMDGTRVVTVPFIKNIPSGPARAALDIPLARHIVDASARTRVRAHLRHAGIDPARSVFIISNVFAINVALGFAPTRLVYDCNDAHADFPGLPRWTRSLQEKTLRCADRSEHRIVRGGTIDE